MLPVLFVFESVVGFEDGRSEPGAGIEFHDCIVEGLLAGFVLLEGCFFQVAVTFLEPLNGMFG